MKASEARDLIVLFVRRDFVATYKQTILGPLWYLIQPLLTALTFTANAGLFGKVYFPRLAVPISIMISNLITFAIQLGLFLGFGIIVSALTTRYRELVRLGGFS